MQALDVSEGLLGGGYKSRLSLTHAALVVMFLVEALVVAGVPAARLRGENGAVATVGSAALNATTDATVDVVELEAGLLATGFGDWEALEIRVVDGELGVVALQGPDRGALDGELAQGVGARFAVRGAHDLE